MTMLASNQTKLYSLTPGALGEILGGSGRAREVWQRIVAAQNPFTDAVLNEKARRRLKSACAPLSLRVVEQHQAQCKTVKLVCALADHQLVETVLIPHRERTTVCVSSQVGCARGCGFCVTATMGLIRSLTTEEIVGQVKLAWDTARIYGMPPVRNVVYMGMGEPLDNLKAVAASVSILTHPWGFALAPRRIGISTVGTSPRAILETRDIPAYLAWSVHAVDDALRRRLVPTSKYSMATLRDAFVQVMRQRGADIFIEMALMHEINDSEAQAVALGEFLQPFPGQVRINLLPMNAGRADFMPTTAERTLLFQQRLRDLGFFCAIRRARGLDAAAACGQLVSLRAAKSA
ncbi:MAG: 23S rRNA (adenine(2503)-C(2))-methyltransferase RlmN [Myxococcota bacterium]